jgi:hypothetical protein
MLSEGGNNVPETQNFSFSCRNQLKETFGQCQCHLATIGIVSGELGMDQEGDRLLNFPATFNLAVPIKISQGYA